MKLSKLLLVFLAAVAFAGNAAAVTYNGVTGTSAERVEDFSDSTLVGFNLDMVQRAPVTLSYTLTAADLLSPTLSFNALVSNLTGTNFERFSFTLGNVSFASTGSFTGFGPASATGSTATYAWATFAAANAADIYFGNPLSDGTSTDWMLNLSGMKAGDTFTITAAVPEPETYAMMLAGLGLVGFAARRRKQKQA